MRNKYLPVVSRDIASSIAAGLRNYDDEFYINEKIEEIKDSNPIIAEWLTDFCPNTEDRIACMFAGIVLYKMLYSQAEAEYMNEEYGYKS